MVAAAPLLVVVGQPGWRCGHIVRELELWQQRGRVRLLRNVDDSDLRMLYSAAMLMVMPSLYEGFGSPVVEAMACGCPVLCSWSSSLPEVGGQAARYFCSDDPFDLAKRLKEVTEDRAELERMAAEGMRQAKRFSYELAAQQMLELMLTEVADENT
jgi:alpha-1,3-rhamnosyl/mannosyltransferase